VLKKNLYTDNAEFSLRPKQWIWRGNYLCPSVLLVINFSRISYHCVVKPLSVVLSWQKCCFATFQHKSLQHL